MTTFHFRVLDAAVVLRGPDDVMGPMAGAYRRFISPEPPPPGTHEIVLESAASRTFSDGSTRVPIIDGASPALQIYDRFLKALFDRISTHAILHAGALVAPGGDALLIAGPSGFGKTSLTLELLVRGLGFLSDDYAPVDLATGRVHPYPRTVGLLPDGSASIPRLFRDAAGNPDSPVLLGKKLIDVGDVLGEAVVATEPIPIGNVVLLDAGGTAEQECHSFIHLGVWSGGVVEAEGLLSKVPGAEVLDRVDREDLTVWRIALRHEPRQTELFSDLLDRDFVAFHETLAGSRPEFSAEPRLAPIRRHEMALYLCREIQNRRNRGQLMSARGGDTTGLFVDVTSSLADARCYRLTVGAFEATADLLEQLVRA